MAIVLANGKKAKLIEQERTFLNTLEFRLFRNDYVPVAGMVAGDFEQPLDTGYAAKVNVGFVAAVLNAANQGELKAPIWTNIFNHDAGNFSVFGWYAIDPADNAVVMAERDPAPFLVDAPNKSYSVVPKKVMDTL